MADTIDPATGRTPEPVLRSAAVQSAVTGLTSRELAKGLRSGHVHRLRSQREGRWPNVRKVRVCVICGWRPSA